MPPKRGTKRKTEDQPESNSDESGRVGQENVNRRRSRGKSLSRLEEYDEDAGRDSSREFQQWAKWLDDLRNDEAKKSKNHLAEFHKKVGKQEKQIREFLMSQEEDLKQRNQRFATAIEQVYAAAAMKPPSLQSSDKGPGGSEDGSHLFQEAQSIISSSRSLLRCYRDTDESLKNRQLELPGATWKKDKEDIKELLACGREHGVKIIEGNLASRAYTPQDENKTKAGEHDQAALNLFKESRKAMEGDSWGTVAAEQYKRFKDLAAFVPKQYFR